MPAAVASHTLKKARATRDSAPPAKKARLAQSPAAARPNGLKDLVNGLSVPKPTAKSNNARTNVRVDETTMVVGGGQAGHGDVDMDNSRNDVIEISSADDESDQESEANADSNKSHSVSKDILSNGHAEEAEEEDAADPEDLSFGDRLRAQEPESVPESRIVDVETAFAEGNTLSRTPATPPHARPLSVPSSNSLGTVLTQALRTNDKDLLESCLQVVDVDAIYATVERLPSPLVGSLLQKLAERLRKKPGRAGMLMLWVQWSLVAHGGYLASQPHLVNQLASLNKVLKERANGLLPLLSLKGRLDMLQSQLDLRRRNQRRAANDDEDEAVIYVEGEDDYASSEEGSVAVHSASALLKTPRNNFDDGDDDDASSVDEMPTTMEVDEDSEDASDESNDLLDDEAEETDLDTGDEMSEPMSDDLDEGEGVSESEEDTKLARRSTAARSGLKVRR